jgi:TIR domain
MLAQWKPPATYRLLRSTSQNPWVWRQLQGGAQWLLKEKLSLQEQRSREEAAVKKSQGEPSSPWSSLLQPEPLGLGTLLAAVVATGFWLRKRAREKASAAILELLRKTPVNADEADLPAQPDPTAPLDVDLVECSVFGRRAARPGDTIMIQVFLHLQEQRERASFQAAAMDSSATLIITRTLEIAVRRGARVEVSFAVSTLHVDDPVQSVVWQGDPAFCQFLVAIPEGTNGRSFFPVVRVSVDGSLIGCIKFRISSDQKATELEPAILGDYARRYKKAFVSYATIDRKEVLKRVQILQILKTKVFLDMLSLEPGERWERKLYEEIKHCDLFLLFWSQAAKDSHYVLEEAKYAYDRQQESPDREPDIVPVILQQKVLPPPFLAELNFNDQFSYLIDLMERAEASETAANDLAREHDR